MPTIPQPTYQGAPRASTSVVRPSSEGTDMSGLSTGMRQAAAALFEKEDRDARTAYNYAKADLVIARQEAIVEMDKAGYFDAKDPDAKHGDFAMERFNESMDQALGEARKNIDPRLAAAFDTEAQLLLAQGRQDAAVKSFKHETDHELSKLSTYLEGLRTAGVSADTPAERREILQMATDAIGNAVDNRYMDQVAGQAAGKQFAEDYAAGVLGAMPPQQRLEVINNPANTVAGIFDPDALRKLRIESENELYAEGVRANAEMTRARSRAVIDSANILMMAEEAYRLGIGKAPTMEMVREQIPYLKPTDRNQLGKYLQLLAEGGVVTRPETLLEIERLKADNPDAFKDIDIISSYRTKLSNEDWRDLLEFHSAAIENDWDKFGELYDTQLLNQYAETAVLGVREKADLIIDYRRQMRVLTEQNGGKPIPPEQRDTLIKALISTAEENFFLSNKMVQDLPEADQDFIMRSIDLWRRRYGTEPTDEQLQEWIKLQMEIRGE